MQAMVDIVNRWIPELAPQIERSKRARKAITRDPLPKLAIAFNIPYRFILVYPSRDNWEASTYAINWMGNHGNLMSKEIFVATRSSTDNEEREAKWVLDIVLSKMQSVVNGHDDNYRGEKVDPLEEQYNGMLEVQSKLDPLTYELSPWKK